MEPFEPGGAYGRAYRGFVWVCLNSLPRQFEKCDTSKEGAAVWQAFQRGIHQLGLGHEVLAIQSGCMLGCKANGVTVAIVCQSLRENPIGDVRFFNNVTVPDVEGLIRTYLLTGES